MFRKIWSLLRELLSSSVSFNNLCWMSISNPPLFVSLAYRHLRIKSLLLSLTGIFTLNRTGYDFIIITNSSMEEQSQGTFPNSIS